MLSSRTSSRGEHVSDHPTAIGSETSPLAEPAPYDSRALHRLREIDPSGAFMRRWIRLFLEDSPKKMHEMEAAMAAGITRPLVRGSHSLKTYAGWLGAQELWQLCHRLEQEARAGSVAECRQLLPDVRSQLKQFQDWLNNYLIAQT